MEIATNYITLELAHRFYKRWDCQIAVKQKCNLYYKCIEGRGEIQFHNGNLYLGDIFDGLLHGKGIFKWLNGVVYEGQFYHNQITGKGKYTWPDGSKYEGQLKQGKRHGYGEYYSAKDKAKYIGTWKNGMKHGRGIIQYENNAYYDGQFQCGKRQGWGKMHYSTGNEYQGEWVDDYKEGKGTMNWLNVNERYVGSWKKDKPNGVGDYYWFDCKIEYKTVKNIYKGQWANGKRQGYGGFYYSNGCKFEGYFKNNCKEGFGIITNQMGDVKVDYFKNDKAVSALMKHMMQNQKEDKHPIKLPEIVKGKKQHKINNSNLCNTSQVSTISISQPTSNQYIKYIDFSQSTLNTNVFNLLLRNHSQLRSWYRTLGIGSISTKDYYTGMTLENFWKLIKDLKLNNDFLSLAKLNRQFLKGNKSKFDIEIPSQERLKLAQKFKDSMNIYNYGELQLMNLKDTMNNIKLDWDKWKVSGNIQVTKNIEKIKTHDPKRIILYRHFICLLVHVAILQKNQHPQPNEESLLRAHIEILLRVIQCIFEQNTGEKAQSTDNITFVSVASMRANVADWSIKHNRQLIEAINWKRNQLIGKQDYTVSVKTLYSLLQKNGYLKDSTEKMLFLQKIERQMNTKIVLFRKDMKHHYSAMDKIVLTSPYYVHIMNYEMIERQFDELMYQAISRKMNGLNQQQLHAKYSQAINNLIKYVKSCYNTDQPTKVKMVRKFSKKDLEREMLQKQNYEARMRELENKKIKEERQRQQIQRKLMKIEDKDIINLQEEDESDEYFD